MKKVKPVAVIFCVALVLASTGFLSAQDEVAKTTAVQITGKNANLVKAVCGDEPQDIDPALGGLNVLIVTEAFDAEGKPLTDLAGKMLHYLPVAAASKLIAGEENAGKVVTVKGILYKESMVVAVAEFEAKAAEGEAAVGSEWDDWGEAPVKSPSQQQVI